MKNKNITYGLNIYDDMRDILGINYRYLGFLCNFGFIFRNYDARFVTNTFYVLLNEHTKFNF